ncbi:MAG: hypothetical protein HY226_01750 [Candidatus Vogelbacteria bacterium]|nr:hypothetical protein [Candidatus Vogelbacteria bacterium]
MVSISIFMVITSITIFNYPKFSNKLSLDLLAEDMALSFRQAQIFGSSVLGARGASGGGKSFSAYGIHLENPENSRTSEYDYLLFADISNTDPQKRQYDGESVGDFAANPGLNCPFVSGSNVGPVLNHECVQIFKITGFNRVRELCLNFDDVVDSTQRVAACDAANLRKQIGSMDVIFVRPNLDARFKIKDNNAEPLVTPVSNVGIVLESAAGDYAKTVVIWETGQISVE